MGWLSDLFTSPRERQAPGMYQGQINSYDDILKQLQGLQDAQGGVSDIASLKSKYGLSGVDQPYAIARKNLATAKAGSLRSASDRMSSTVGNAESVFSPIESDYAQSSGALEGEAANANIGEQHYEANLLDQILGKQNQFNMGKQQLRSGVLGQKGNALQDYLQSISGASSFDDILAGLDTFSKFMPKGKDLPPPTPTPG